MLYQGIGEKVLRSTTFLIITLCALVTRGEVPRDPTAAMRAEYECPEPESKQQVLELAEKLGKESYALNSLGCAADLLFQAASLNSTNYSLIESAMEAHIAYLQQVHIEKDADFIGVHEAEWKGRLGRAEPQLQQLDELIKIHEPDFPGAAIVRARTITLLHRYDTPRNYVASVKLAIKMLEKSTEENPQISNGSGEALLGRLYFELPPMYGGSIEKSIAYLNTGISMDKENITWRRYLAEALEEAGDTKGLIAELAFMAEYNIQTTTDLQLVSDQWQYGIGLATRAGLDELHDRFVLRRNALLEQHPELKNRIRTAVGGHGGENPLTGETQY